MSKEPVTREELATSLEKMGQRITALEARPQAVTQSQTPSPSGSDPNHPYGLCSDPACASCVAQGQEIFQIVMGQYVPEARNAARNAALNDLQKALTWAGGPALADRIAQFAEDWVKAGRPEPQAEPALMTVVEG